jgi:hypothetical protein
MHEDARELHCPAVKQDDALPQKRSGMHRAMPVAQPGKRSNDNGLSLKGGQAIMELPEEPLMLCAFETKRGRRHVLSGVHGRLFYTGQFFGVSLHVGERNGH